jgi:hypothetical protein
MAQPAASNVLSKLDGQKTSAFYWQLTVPVLSRRLLSPCRLSGWGQLAGLTVTVTPASRVSDPPRSAVACTTWLVFGA